MPTKCSIHNCTKPSVSKGLCDTHRKRVARHGNPEQTRPSDWGAKEKHPKYKSWCALRRYHRDAMPENWASDFWNFVAPAINGNTITISGDNNNVTLN